MNPWEMNWDNAPPPPAAASTNPWEMKWDNSYEPDAVRGAYQSTMNTVAAPINNAVGDVAGAVAKVIPQPIKDKLSTMGNYLANEDKITSPIYTAAKEGITQIGENINDLKSYNQDLAYDLPALTENAKLAGNMALAKPVSDIASSIGDNAANSLARPQGHFGGTPPIDPRIAQLVSNADKIGINVPTRIFNPGAVSGALHSAGIIGDTDTKGQVMTALSKAMGHSGTSNLDVGTIAGIQKTIGTQMNNFALKADQMGGIPVAKDELVRIANDSNAMPAQSKRLINRIVSVAKDGKITGSDYKEMTQKGSPLYNAMKSSNSDLADTAASLREYLDGQLEKTVLPEDLAAFKENRRQYRTMKIIQPIAESGGVTGQADSATKLYNGIIKNYGSIENALKYNPSLGIVAQTVNEFPEVLASPLKGRAARLGGLAAGQGAAIGGAMMAGAPSVALAAIPALPAAAGAGKYLSSNMRRNALLRNSLPPKP